MGTVKFWGRRILAASVAVGVLTAVGVVEATPAQALTGIGNGSFETPVVTPGTFQTFVAGMSMGAWTVSQGTVDLIGSGFWQATDGMQSLDLNGGQTGGVTQTFTTVPLLKYRVTYKLAGNPASGPTVKTGAVVANGGVIQNFSFDITGKSFTNMGYVGKETHFIATGLSSTLEFRSTNAGAFGPVIDEVEVVSCLLVICIG